MSYLKNNNPGTLKLRTLVSLLAGFFFLGLTACERKAQQFDGYFAFDSLLQAQLNVLLANNASVKKSAVLKGIESSESLTPDSSSWVSEFQVFSGLEVMNKPIYRNQYEKEVEKTGVSKTIRFVARKPDLPVQKLVLAYDNDDRLVSLEADFNESNSMYYASRTLKLEFGNLNETMVLSQYSINGGQKMFLADSVTYAVNGRIHLP